MVVDDDNLILEDWKMTKDRIKHFDDVVMKTRVGGLPIATAIQAAAFATADTFGKNTVQIAGMDFSVFSLIIGASLVYLFPIAILDLVHFLLLRRSVAHAWKIEEMPQFKDKLQITHKLTGKHLTILHIIGGYLIYIAVFGFGVYFAFTVKL